MVVINKWQTHCRQTKVTGKTSNCSAVFWTIYKGSQTQMCVCVFVYQRVYVYIFVGVCLLLERHVKDSRRCGEIQWWACFITSHIETNLCPFTRRTASYSLTKLASRCGVRGPPQAHTHNHRGRYRQSCNIVHGSPPPLLSRKLPYIFARPVARFPSLTLTHMLTHSPGEGSGCGVIAVIVVGCVCAPVMEVCRPPCGTRQHRCSYLKCNKRVEFSLSRAVAGRVNVVFMRSCP